MRLLAITLALATLCHSQEQTFDGGKILRATNVIQKTYGDTVSILEKGKELAKFGSNSAVSTSFETVAEFQGSVANETFVTTNLIDTASSSNAADTMTLTVEGHTIDESGNLTFVTQDVTLTGQTEKALTTPLARCTRAFVKASGTFNSPQSEPAGIVYFYDNTDGSSAGVPTTPAATKLTLQAGETQTNKCATSVSSKDYWIIMQGYFGVGQAGGSASTVTFRVQTRDVANGGVWRPSGSLITVQVGGGSSPILFDPCIIVPKNHDVRVQAATDANSAAVFAELDGVLALIKP